MRTIQQLFFSILFSCFFTSLFSQPLEVTNAPPITPDNLITNVFLGEGVEVVNVSFEGNGQSVGFFKNGEMEVGIDRGLVMTSGFAVSEGPNTGVDATGGQFASVNNNSTTTDPDLLDIAHAVNPNVTINNVTKYTITFIPISDTLRFKYAFGSEEYPEYACSQYNDIFGFFISGPGITGPYENNGVNIAQIPGTDLPVTINNVNAGVPGANGTVANCTPPLGSLDFSEFYNDNNGSNVLPVYDGMTDVFTAEIVVEPCQEYTIKLAICDVADGALDSGVFLEAKSFGTGSLQVEAVTASLDGSIAEGCSEGLLSFVLPVPTESDYPIDFQLLGTAENGVDYEFIPPDLFIPAGDSIVTLPIVALEDFIDEGQETLLIDIQRDPCNRDTFTILIRENPLVDPVLPADTIVCEGQPVLLTGTLDVPLPEPPFFQNDQDLEVSPTNVPVFSEIDVLGVIPPILGPGVIKQVCIDSLSHPWIDDIDIFLISPGGQFIELTTDNGGNGGNGLGPDYYINTCFTVDAMTLINAPGPFAPPDSVPFTGTYLPEGVWSDLWDGENPSNGTWQLQVVDDQNGLEGTLHSWSICFNPVYEIEYRWEPAAGLSCADCPEPIATPSETTTYIMTASDSYGCSVMDSVTIEVIDAPDAPNVQCGTITNSSISIFWDDDPNANGFEVNVDGSGWITPTGSLSHQVDGLDLSQAVAFQVRSLGDPCPGLVSTIVCETPACTPPTFSVNITDVSCFGDGDGTASITADGGVPPYEFELEGISNTDGNFTGLQAGSYVAVITDDLGCPATVPILIDEPEGLNVNPLLIEPLDCNGDSDASATVEISGGSGSFTFAWSNNSADSIAVGLDADVHYVTITDGNGCSQIDSVVIDQPELLTLDLNGTDVSCADAQDGTALATPIGGTGNYSYEWSDGQMTEEATGLSGGTIDVIVTDENGCSVTESIEILENEPLAIQVSGSNPLCNNGADGSAEVLVEGGTGSYTYVWSINGSVIGSDSIITNLTGGTYQIIVTDSNNCQSMESIELESPSSVSGSFVTMPPDCVGENTGSAEITITGGNEPYEFNWSDIGIDDESRADLSAGFYEVTVSDANGCEAIIPIVIPAAEAITLAFDVTPVSCNGGDNGIVTVIPDGGAGGFTYDWSNGQQSQTATDLEAGTVQVVVMDANGCTMIDEVEITQFDPIALDISGEDPSCNGGADGTATISAEGGAGGYSYQWSNTQTGETATQLEAGIEYLVFVTDQNGCMESISITLDEPTALAATTESGLVSCNGVPDGSASVNPDGGTEPYSYLWSDANAQTTQTATGLDVGIYTVTITDANGCEITESVEVLPATEIVVEISGTDVTCNSGTDGTITVTANGGTGNFSYSWNDSGLPSQADQPSVEAGNYEVTVSDGNGCTEIASIIITEPSAIVLTADIQVVTCANGQDGAIDLSVSGGVSPYEVRWNTNANEEDLTDLPSGTYTANVTDANGCVETIDIDIAEPDVLEATFEITPVECYGEQTGGIATTVRGGIQPYTYKWSNDQTNPNLTEMPSGFYELLITDANGCQLNEFVNIPQPEAPVSALITVDAVTCYGDRDGMITIDAAGGTPFYTYSLTGQTFTGNSRMIGMEPGEYQVYVRDAKGCQFVSEPVFVNEPDPVEVDLGPDITIPYGENVTLDPEVTGAIGNIFYEWTPKDTLLSCLDCVNPVTNVLGQTSFKVIVEDENGCEAEDIITIFIEKTLVATVPSGFTPNNDGQNDRLLVHGHNDTKVLNFKVFDRWGELLYENGDFMANSPAEGWDGTFRGSQSSGGVYIWVIKVEYRDGSIEILSGNTTLIR